MTTAQMKRNTAFASPIVQQGTLPWEIKSSLGRNGWRQKKKNNNPLPCSSFSLCLERGTIWIKLLYSIIKNMLGRIIVYLIRPQYLNVNKRENATSRKKNTLVSLKFISLICTARSNLQIQNPHFPSSPPSAN